MILSKSGFEKFKEKFPSKEKFYTSLIGTKISDKEYNHVFKAWDRFEMKAMNDCHELYLKYDALFLSYVFKRFRNSSLKVN